jgi:hypothetical protein
VFFCISYAAFPAAESLATPYVILRFGWNSTSFGEIAVNERIVGDDLNSKLTTLDLPFVAVRALERRLIAVNECIVGALIRPSRTLSS